MGAKGGGSADAPKNPKVLFLFDVDGTLTPSRGKAEEKICAFLRNLRKEVLTGFVGGSDISKQRDQLGEGCMSLFLFAFPENGVQFYENGELKSDEKYIEKVGEDLHKEIVDFSLEAMSKIKLPRKRGNFIEYRTSMINISPIGRSCTQQERKEFVEYDNKHGIRKKLIDELREKFKGRGLTFSIGGEISIDCFPEGWDKTYCLGHLEGRGIEQIHFFGDMTRKGGNDHEIANDPRVIPHTVTSPEDTMEQAGAILEGLGGRK